MIEAAQIRGMSMAERLRAMEQLWDTLCREAEDIPSPRWHSDVLAERKKRVESGEARFITLEQLRARLRASRS